jgi:hypothetical protein
MKKTQNNAKGKLLWIMIVLFLSLSIFGLYLPTDLVLNQYVNAPIWLANVIFVWTLVDIGIVVGIWMWKKWAVYGFIISFLLGVLMEILILTPTSYNTSFLSVFFQTLMLVAIYRKWHHFK